MLINAKIRKAGLYFNGHFNTYSIRIILDIRGGGAAVEIPVEKTEEFMSMFSDELDLENGVFVHDLKGVPVVLKTADNRYSKIVAIGNILATEDELMNLNED